MPWSSATRVHPGVELSSAVSAPREYSTAVVSLDVRSCSAVGAVVAPAAMRR